MVSLSRGSQSSSFRTLLPNTVEHCRVSHCRWTIGSGVCIWFEPAEAYANLGILGCFLVSSIISYLLARLLTYAFSRNSVLLLAYYITNGLMMTRSTWYQNFVFARLASIMLVFYVLIWFIQPSLLSFKVSLKNQVTNVNQ